MRSAASRSRCCRSCSPSISKAPVDVLQAEARRALRALRSRCPRAQHLAFARRACAEPHRRRQDDRHGGRRLLPARHRRHRLPTASTRRRPSSSISSISSAGGSDIFTTRATTRSRAKTSRSCFASVSRRSDLHAVLRGDDAARSRRQAFARRAARDLRQALEEILARRPSENPVARFGARLAGDLTKIQGEGLPVYHAWAFATIRQLGAGMELLALHLKWRGDETSARAAAELDKISQSAKALILKGARAVNAKRALDAGAIVRKRWRRHGSAASTSSLSFLITIGELASEHVRLVPMTLEHVDALTAVAAADRTTFGLRPFLVIEARCSPMSDAPLRSTKEIAPCRSWCSTAVLSLAPIADVARMVELAGGSHSRSRRASQRPT